MHAYNGSLFWNVLRYRSANYTVMLAGLWMPWIDQHDETNVPDFTYETPRKFSTAPIDKTVYGEYTASKRQLRRFSDEVYLLQQHACHLGLVDSNRV